MIYRDMAQQRAQTAPQLCTFYFVEQNTDGRPATSGDKVDGEIVGRLSVAAVWPKIRAPFEATFYLSGPPPMLKTISQDLRELGIRPDAIRIDAWE